MIIIRKIASFILIALLVFTVSGCLNKGTSPPSNESAQQQNNDAAVKEKNVMDNYNALIQQRDVNIPETIKFINDNIDAVSPQNGSTMVIELEKLQNDKLPKLQDKFADNESVQKAAAKGYKNGIDENYINNIQDKSAKDLLLEAKNSGYKIETAEGMFFPVIDYSFYKKYRNAVTQDIASFIDIMAIESDKTPVKDAALIISWSEILQRAANQERFIRENSSSAKTNDMRQLLKRYTAFAMYGANNTPLFTYETKEMDPEAKKTYLETAFSDNNGSFSQAMNGYQKVLRKNDYKLTKEVQEYRNKASEEIH